MLDNGEEAACSWSAARCCAAAICCWPTTAAWSKWWPRRETVSTVRTADAVDARARRLSPGQSPRAAADRRRLAALPARSRARRHGARLRARGRRRGGAVRARRRRVCRGHAARARHIRTAEPARGRRPLRAPTSPQLLRLLHLASPALPIGAFHFSQGLEYAVECGWVTRRSQCARVDRRHRRRPSLATLDLPVLDTAARCLATG